MEASGWLPLYCWLDWPMPLDTSPAAADRQLAAWQALSPEARLKIALDLSQAVAELRDQGRRDRVLRDGQDTKPRGS